MNSKNNGPVFLFQTVYCRLLEGMEGMGQFFQVLKQFAWKNHYGWYSLMKSICYLLRTSIGTFCVWVKAVLM